MYVTGVVYSIRVIFCFGAKTDDGCDYNSV